ncbi:hypothetical protein KRR26_35735 [Corallococcus sp. M34]|nr:hypothetical protein [Citreicoccus inhibens]MBU8900960.1 hypothetical protein [Citreicoccus inhibens]
MAQRPASAPSFWPLQLGRWGLYAGLLIITFLPIISAEGGALNQRRV